MPEQLKKEIENHLATFPERHEDLIEMKKEWKEFKDKILWIIVGFLGSILAMGVWVGSIETKIEEINYKVDRSLTQDQAALITQRLDQLTKSIEEKNQIIQQLDNRLRLKGI